MTTMITTPAATPALAWDHSGHLGLGTRLDGAGPAWFDLAGDVHTFSGVISGPKGSGKSTTARALAAAARASQVVPLTTLYTDLSGGMENPLLAEIASIPILNTTPGTAIDLLHDAVEVRAEILRDRGERSLAGTELPVILAVVEGADRIVGNRPQRWMWVARRARKLNIALLPILIQDDNPNLAGQRPPWRLLSSTNRIQMRGSRTLAGIARIRDAVGNEHDTQVPYLADGDPWLRTEIAPDDALDPATATVFDGFYIAPPTPVRRDLWP
ncbi:hypothetical protein BS329_15520 [Amycolatopsis coloradensis]|uniref:Uncharacterized protein n=1 Tax=Amycolatopsis coloradensis TaxID=76021 RepID=A0A1R0KU66_9PSEU|nr:hypothetical protein [Amycolatopsis coloradensis]OLZ51672.1 hypothetical protein BS329_15520 [Amycolatopsis coloradensis]